KDRRPGEKISDFRSWPGYEALAADSKSEPAVRMSVSDAGAVERSARPLTRCFSFKRVTLNA
ncbi:MAG: hypothetical protein ABEK12_00255, partial [Candidatus Nanohaloarchaea archaeon]